MKKIYLKDQILEFELSYGSYQIFFTGGWYIKNLEDLKIKLIDIETNEIIKLKSKKFIGLRKQDFIGNQKAVLAFEFDVLKLSKLKISIKNSENLILKKAHPFLFLYNLLYPKKVKTEEIMLIIK